MSAAAALARRPHLLGHFTSLAVLAVRIHLASDRDVYPRAVKGITRARKTFARNAVSYNPGNAMTETGCICML